MTTPSLSAHVDYLPGWKYRTVTLDDLGPLRDEHVAVFDRVIAATLAGHPYRLYRGENWVIVGVAPPAAAEAMARVERAMATQLGAFDDRPENSN